MLFPEDFDYNSNYNNFFKRTDLVKMRNDLYLSEKFCDSDIFQLHTAINVKLNEIHEEIETIKVKQKFHGTTDDWD